MSEEQGGFFGQIKNQIITTVGLIITAAGGLVITNMEAIFGVAEEVVEQPMMEQTINLPEASTDTIVITKKIEVAPTPAPKPEKTETEKRKEDFDW